MRDAGTRAAVESALGAPVRDVRALGGGDINEAWAVTLGDGREAFVKTNRGADPGMFPAEARGLAWLAEPAVDGLRVPRVLAVEARFLALEMLAPGRRRASFDEELGRGLARLHASGAPGFGLDHDNFIGSLPQENGPAATWPEFWMERRLLPQVRRAVEGGALPGSVARGFERLGQVIDELVGPAEPPSRLHGDLWSGNVHVGPDDEPCVIDPAAYGGHREVDLAMLQLFGSPSERFFAAYEQVAPLAAGWRDRVGLYQLYPLLVHVNLFGGGYARSVQDVLARYV